MPATSYDTELRRHTEALLRAAGIRARDHVLDIGCGAGQTTRLAARSAAGALGVDISGPAIGRARELARSDGLGNATFEQGDAQVHRFGRGRFDVVISRFGTMFFDDPGAAFANIERALRPGGRLVMLVWQAGDRNEWEVAIRQSLGVVGPSGGAFSLGDPPTVSAILTGAGFTDIGWTDVREPVHYGPDVAAALDWVNGFADVGDTLRRLTPAAAAHATDRLRATLTAHLSAEGVRFDSRAWIITARR